MLVQRVPAVELLATFSTGDIRAGGVCSAAFSMLLHITKGNKRLGAVRAAEGSNLLVALQPFCVFKHLATRASRFIAGK